MLDLKYSRETFPQTSVTCSSGQSKSDAQLLFFSFFKPHLKEGKYRIIFHRAHAVDFIFSP